MNANLNWHVVFCKPNFEQKVAQLLTQRGIENYCPLHSIAQKEFQQVKEIRKPLFASYVFVYCTESQLQIIKSIKGVINLLYWLNKPVVVSEQEIGSIRYVLQHYHRVQLEKTGVLVENDQSTFVEEPVFSLSSLGYRMIASEERVASKAKPSHKRWLGKEVGYQYTGKSLQSVFKNLSAAFGSKATRIPTP